MGKTTTNLAASLQSYFPEEVMTFHWSFLSQVDDISKVLSRRSNSWVFIFRDLPITEAVVDKFS